MGPFEFTRVPGTHNWSVQISEKFNSFFRRPVTRTGGGCRINSGPRVIHDLYKTALKLAKDVENCDQLEPRPAGPDELAAAQRRRYRRV